LDLGRELRRRHIVAAIGHTAATYQDVVKAVENGYTHATHMFSAMSAIRREKAYRISGVIEAVLELDELTTEMIADGHHLPPSLIKLTLKAKGRQRVCLTTDAMAAAGQGPGRYALFGLDVVVEDDIPPEFEVRTRLGQPVAKLADRTAFASSVATMDQVVRTMVELVGMPLTEAIKMVTMVPAAIHGWEAERGLLSPGLAGDVVILDEQVHVFYTIVGGRIVYKRTP
jgi:N-acetylglucosamine-6-phosphate deacetylase